MKPTTEEIKTTLRIVPKGPYEWDWSKERGRLFAPGVKQALVRQILFTDAEAKLFEMAPVWLDYLLSEVVRLEEENTQLRGV